MPGCCRVAGCCRVLPDCRVPARTSSQLVWALRLPGCQVRLPGCRVRLPGCRVAGGCRVLQGCRVVAGVLPGWCRVRLPGCQGQGSSSLACKQTAPTPREIQCLRTRGAQQLHEVSHRAASPTSMSLGSICSHVDHSALRRGAARRPSMMLHRDRLGSAAFCHPMKSSYPARNPDIHLAERIRDDGVCSREYVTAVAVASAVLRGSSLVEDSTTP